MSTTDAEDLPDDPVDAQPVEELVEEVEPVSDAPAVAVDSASSAAWTAHFQRNSIPSLFLDRRLRILKANRAFCALFGCDERIEGVYFTQFFGPSFDARKSSELFRAILSPEGRFEWNGKLERIGTDQLLNVSKVWIQPVVDARDGAPPAYSAICLDMTSEHRQLLHGTFTSLLGAARLKDNDTGNHIERVNRYARVLAQDLAERQDVPEVDREFVETIGLVAALHDVGKIGTPDDILNKAGQLETWEWDIMKQHTINGAYILSTYPNPMAREIALNHHERWDGTGYPMGLAGTLIPLSARIVAVADVYDALRMRRAYKDAYTHEQALDNMVGEKGSHFDPFVIERFQVVADAFRTIFSDLADTQ
jgi:HD-GYP domain-containing protein (c-di-GMP phosphodiesterase class II)